MTPGKGGDDKDNPLHFSGEIKDWTTFKEAIQSRADARDTTWLIETGRAIALFFASQIKDKTGSAATRCLDQRRHGSARTCSLHCTLTPAACAARSRLQLALHARRDPFRDKIREVGRGLSLADTQTGRYGRLYSRRRICARRGADAQLLLRSFSNC
jgi:hypothetical protein